ncbi:MAG: glycoside hydrolase family 88 protein [Bacteroidales bacterium]|nr:glycoside hydrolase family 88 protein [Bacteroidales bacterium]
MIRKLFSAFYLPLLGLFMITCSGNGGETDQKQEKHFWPADKAPEKIGKMLCDELFTRPDYMMYITPEIRTIHYAEACAAYGVARFAGEVGDKALLQTVISRYENIADSGLISDVGHVDVNVYGILPLEIYRQTGVDKFLLQGKELADKQWVDPLANGMSNQTRFWIDDIYMISSLQVQAYRATGNAVYLQNASLEVTEYLIRLQQENGLFHHGENAPFFWGRGNGWVAAGLAELISEIPEKDVYYNDILTGYKRMMDALVKYQAEDGMWRQLIDHAEAWKETSSTAMFGYALLMGVEHGILEGPEYRKAYQKAWLALCDYVDDEGKLREVCVGTGQSQDAEFYLERPRVTGDFHGQAPMLWFAAGLIGYESQE